MAKFTFSKALNITNVGQFAVGDTADLEPEMADKLEAAGFGKKAKPGRPKKTDEEG